MVVRIFFIATLILQTGYSVLAETATAWLAFPAGFNYDWVEKDGIASVRIPVTMLPKAPSITELRAKLRDVVFRNGREEAISPTIQADFDGGDAHHGPTLVVKADALANRPGNYVLSLDVFRINPDTNQPYESQPLTLTLQQPVPNIALGPPVAVEDILSLGGHHSNTGQLVLQERSGKSSLKAVEFTQLSDKPDPGALTINLISNLVPASGVRIAQVLSAGGFPLGKSTGKIQIRARELDEPLVIAYEVTTRRTSLWILILVALGFGGGYIVRHVLRDQQEIAVARVGASDALRQINDAGSNIGDSVFQAAVAGMTKNLIETARHGKATEIQAAVTKAFADLSKAQKDLADRVKQIGDQLQPLYAALHQKWQLPERFKSRLVTTTEKADAAANLLQEQNTQAAQKGLDAILAGDLLGLLNGLGKWQNETSRYFADLTDAPPPLLDKGTDQLREATQRWTNQFGAAISNNPTISIAEVSGLFSAAHTAYGNALSIADDLRNSTVRLVDALGDFSSANGVQIATESNRIKEISLRASELVRNDLERPNDARADLIIRHKGVLAAGKAFLKGLIPEDADPQTINTAIEHNQWVAAMNAADVLIKADSRKAAPGVAAFVASVAKGAKALPKLTASSIVFNAAVLSNDGLDLVLKGKPTLQGGTLDRQFYLRQAEKASFLQTAVFAVIFMGIAYMVYKPTWVGTLYEMFGIFLWAFGVDITSDAIMAAAKKLKLPEV